MVVEELVYNKQAVKTFKPLKIGESESRVPMSFEVMGCVECWFYIVTTGCCPVVSVFEIVGDECLETGCFVVSRVYVQAGMQHRSESGYDALVATALTTRVYCPRPRFLQSGSIDWVNGVFESDLFRTYFLSLLQATFVLTVYTAVVSPTWCWIDFS